MSTEPRAVTRLLADLLWKIAKPLTASNDQADAEWLRSFKEGKAGLTLRERIGYKLWGWSLRLHNPAGNTGLDDDGIKHPGGDIEPFGTGR